ncbi:pirin family protein [Shewanella fidelis]|uniref:Pirin family protein n=1 Tax=Shewanella fidelis TaxID=173509 RepID=A0AAW8NH79_9GAMM|nr:pirin family protein [Shewanella fidelis]MDR8522508.1 pirin family protein [Shewanella fidelis]MDW4812958.1 pirin family protein [Shewanella fidelis]MDW4816783.1 pirin family protein [Shewanella fidelis]MDW4820965.1 pirin family protein [Shewanella fidelis]MDW4825500.1 pirin family protein [Shewanella fidelis]
MKLLSQHQAHKAMDGDGVNIRRVADFNKLGFDPFLMIDEIKSDDKSDFIGGFPPHPHRGIETFTYILKGGFEHRDQLGNVKAIRAGDVQWMSTGSGVIHSEMPLADTDAGLHGFQIWLNMPAKDKMRPARYQDSGELVLPEAVASGVYFKALAGRWQFANQVLVSPLAQLAGRARIADVTLLENAKLTLNLGESSGESQFLGVYIYSGSLKQHLGFDSQYESYQAGQLLVLDSHELLQLDAEEQGAGLLLLSGQAINESVVHMGPFVMNTQAEIRQAVEDYQMGRFGQISD